MELNVGFQGQRANVNENDHKIPLDNAQQILKEDLEMEGDNQNSTEKKTTDIVCRGNEKPETELSSHSDQKAPQVNESVENNIESASSVVSEVVGVLCSEGLDTVADICVMKANKNETNCNIEQYPSKQDTRHASEDTNNVLQLINNNQDLGFSKETSTFTKNIVGTSKSSEMASADGSSEMLLKEVTKLNISPGEKLSKGADSKVVVNKHSESLKSLMAYDGDSDDSEHNDTEPQAEVCDLSSEDEDNNTDTKKTWRKNTEDASGTSDSESDSSASTLSLESDSDGEISDGDSASVIDASIDGDRISSIVDENSDKGAVKKKNSNILDMEEFLPPLPDLSKLNINVDEAEFMHIGRISAIISELVTITAIPGTPAFDLDSMVFTDGETTKKPIGPIYDVLGPVTEPIYCVRFNNEKEIREMGLKSGMKVYTIPKNEEFTKYVFVQELMKIKGSDASWCNDHETPSELAEYSDDEKEREAKRVKKSSMKRKLNDGSLERHKRYEKTMNQCNTLNTRVCRLMDAQKNLSKHIRHSVNDDIRPPAVCPGLPSIPPALFDPTVPPPGFGQSSLYSISMQPPILNPSSDLGQPATLSNSLSRYAISQNGVPGSFYDSPMLFGHYYANEPPSPQNLCPPPPHWSWKKQCEEFRRPHRSNNPRANQQNSDNYFSNNGRNFRGAGPSSQPF